MFYFSRLQSFSFCLFYLLAFSGVSSSKLYSSNAYEKYDINDSITSTENYNEFTNDFAQDNVPQYLPTITTRQRVDTNNTVLGIKAMPNNVTGNDNTAIGVSSLRSNKSGNKNTATGASALYDNTEGSYNSAYGVDSLRKNVKGIKNTAIGHIALLNNTDGNFNTAIGNRALASHILGDDNTAVGRRALVRDVGGINNTALGSHAGVSQSGLINATAIGANAVVRISNNMMFGSDQVVGWGFGGATPSLNIEAIRVGMNGTNGNGATLTVGGVWTNASDRSKKYETQDLSYGLQEILQLHPVTYKLKETDKEDIGFIAQEVKAIIPEVVYGQEGEMTLSYGQLTSVLTKAIQEQQATIEELKNMLQQLLNERH